LFYCLAADLPAKAKLCFMKTFNGFYSCSFCNIQGNKTCGHFNFGLKDMDQLQKDKYYLPRDPTETFDIITKLNSGMNLTTEDKIGFKGVSPLWNYQLFSLKMFSYDLLH
jgi:hypothetical protein